MLYRHVELWNARDKAAWLDAWQRFVPGEPMFEDPVGTPVRRGWDALAAVWDTAQPSGVSITIEKLIVCGNEAVALMANEVVIDGAPFVADSIEVYVFNQDGSCLSRTYMDPAP